MPSHSGLKAWSANTRTWAMSEYTDLPVSEIGSEFSVGPEGIYVCGSGPLDAESRLETGELNLINGANYNVGRLYLTLRETAGVEVTATASYYDGRSSNTYVIDHLAADAVSGVIPVTSYEKERNVPLGRGPDGNGWSFAVTAASGSWRVTNFELQINRARKARR